jgi:hypothetical protein
MAVLVASVVLLYLLFLVLAVLVIVLYRQFGLVYVGSRRAHEMRGPGIGESAPTGLRVVKPENSELSLELNWSEVSPGGATLLLLGGETCPICHHLLQHLDEASPLILDHIRILFVDKSASDAGFDVPSSVAGRWQHWRSPESSVHDAFDVDVSPFAFVIDDRGVTRAKGIVSTIQSMLALLQEAQISERAVLTAAGPELNAPELNASSPLAAEKQQP